MMRLIIICLLALGISVSASAQTTKKTKKKTAPTEQKADSTPAPAKDNTAAPVKDDATSQPAEDENKGKFDYKSANKKAAEKIAPPADDEDNGDSTKTKSGSSFKGKGTSKTGSKTSSKTPSKTAAAKPKPAPKPKPMTAAEKKKAAEEAAEIEAATPKGIEALYYQFPVEDLPVVKAFMDLKQSQSPSDELHRVKIKDDISLRKQIIRFKDIEHGYMMLQIPGETKYTKMQVYKKKNGNLIMAIEQTDCQNSFCSGTLVFYTKTAGGWKESTADFYPQIDHKFVISKLKSAYKKEYKDLELYDSHNYEESEDNLKKAITYQIAPEDGSIVISEQNLPCKLYTMAWDPKKEKFELKKVEN